MFIYSGIYTFESPFIKNVKEKEEKNITSSVILGICTWSTWLISHKNLFVMPYIQNEDRKVILYNRSYYFLSYIQLDWVNINLSNVRKALIYQRIIRNGTDNTMAKRKRTNNNLQNTTQITKDWAMGIQKTRHWGDATKGRQFLYH